ncbi:MAG: hypothetical protein H6Q15_442 [Bacteroidetes bacterium]|nr:hypothetical protein [Bacteroidota bacterium]
MLNRHFFRAKALQALYAYQVSNSSDILDAEKKLLVSLEKLSNLQVYLFSAILEIRSIAIEQIEEAKQKYYPSEEELNPSLRFVENKMLSQLVDNADLTREIVRLKVNWSDSREVIKNIFTKFKNSESYKNYINSQEESYDADKLLIVQLFKNYIIKNEQLYDIICELELNWECDYEILTQYLIKYLKDFKEEDNTLKRLLKVFDDSKEDLGLETDKEFLLKIFRKTVEKNVDLEQMIEKRIQNWEVERLAILDILIIKMGLVELMYCPTIPIRVTLNEYIELSKEFSTEKSKLFVNGLLDKLVVDLRSLGKIKKIDQGIEVLEGYE